MSGGPRTGEQRKFVEGISRKRGNGEGGGAEGGGRRGKRKLRSGEIWIELWETGRWGVQWGGLRMF